LYGYRHQAKALTPSWLHEEITALAIRPGKRAGQTGAAL